MSDPALVIAILAVLAAFVFFGLWLSTRARCAQANKEIETVTQKRADDSTDVDARVAALTQTIVEQGTHEELLAKKAFYADLYEAQFSGPVVEA